ncbi:TonB-dependent receptor [Hyphococcus sp.]|jgi:TonB-dependent receptor|uniref:TonB-dependent receptor n=1 Tax=Hyphococcus sp. TaxID=2038636 RepID=UPI003D0C2B12
MSMNTRTRAAFARPKFQSRLLKACCAAALGCFAAMPAAAQDEGEEPADEIVVYGEALSLKRAVDAKRNSTNIMDATVQDDIGRLPDLNTAAVIRRITGVAVQNDQAEARFPIIRGLNPTYNRTTIDGGIVSSPERGGSARAVPLDVIPASLLGRLEVVKSVTPELDGNAIGGTINVVTRSAFDQEDPFFYGSAFVGFHEQSGDGSTLSDGEKVQPWRANFATGTRFGPDEQFGVVIGFDYSVRNFEIPQVEVDDADYTEFDDAGNNVGLGNGNGIVVPTNNRIFFYNNTRQRIGGSGKLEWQPSEQFELSISGLYTQFNDDERRDEFTYELGTSGASSQPSMITDQTPTSGVTQTGYGFVGIGRFILDRKIYNAQADATWRPTDVATFDARFTYSGAKLHNPESTEAFQTDATFGAVYDTTDFFPRAYPLDPEGFYNPASYAHTNRGELDRYADDEVFEAAVNGEFDFDTIKIKAGGVYRDRTKDEGFVFNRYVSDGAYTLADVPDTKLADVDYQGNYKFLFRIDSDGANDFYAANPFTNTATSVSASSASEQVYAGYVQGTLEFGDMGSLTGGVRVEHTSWDGGPVAGDQVSGDYTNFLPSAVARFNLADDFVLRLAASRTIGRPNISDLTRGFTPGTDGTDLTLSRSNPDLDPRKSTNLDASLEWYIPDGIIAAGVFYKDISDEIFVLTTTDANLTVDGVVYDRVTQPENAAKAEILGLEAQYQQVLSFLPAPWNGLGVGANVTWLDTDFVVPLSDGTTRSTTLLQQPDLTYNFTLFYQTEYFEVRGSYNFTGEFLDLLNANNPDQAEYWDERGQLDLQARVNLNDNFSIVAEAVNVTDEGRTELTGPGAQFLQEDARFGRTFWLGFNASF